MTPRLECSLLNIHIGKLLQTCHRLANYKVFFIQRNSSHTEIKAKLKQVITSNLKDDQNPKLNLALLFFLKENVLLLSSMGYKFATKNLGNRLEQTKAGLIENLSIMLRYIVFKDLNPLHFNVEYPAFTKVNSEVFSTKNSYA